MRRLLVGLGNPGERYARTRHNIGFRWLDRLAEQSGVERWQVKYRGRVARVMRAGEECWLLKPETFMNASGEAVQAAMAGLRVKPPQVLVAHDELDLPFGTLRFKVGGGAGGHNGIRSIQTHVGDVDFVRLRFGIGHPGKGADVTAYVLGRHPEAEEAALEGLFARADQALERWITDGLQAATQWLHTPTGNES